jgi:polyphenol oxidase
MLEDRLCKQSQVQSFAALSGISGFRHGFISRVSGRSVDTADKEQALAILAPAHDSLLEGAGIDLRKIAYAEQVHGADLKVVTAANCAGVTEGVDGLLTNGPGIALGIYVADCAAVWVVDPVNRALALLHSGKKGSELGIVRKALERMKVEYGSRADQVMVQVSPCIRPPAYEIDFAAMIRRDCLELGVLEARYFDEGVCTAANNGIYYSYRKERGHTGRMLAFGCWS